MMENLGPNFAPPNNPRGVNPRQRQILEEMIEKGLLFGTKEGIDYLTAKEADKLIMEVRQRQKDGNDTSRILE